MGRKAREGLYVSTTTFNTPGDETVAAAGKDTDSSSSIIRSVE